MPVGDSTVLMQNRLAAQKIHLKGTLRRQEKARIVKIAGFFTPALSNLGGFLLPAL
jgi:hypothetical protein